MMENLDRNRDESFISLVVREETLRPGVILNGQEPTILRVNSESHTIDTINHGLYMARLGVARRIIDSSEFMELFVPRVSEDQRSGARGASATMYSERFSIEVGFVDLSPRTPRNESIETNTNARRHYYKA
jgi:hypothetical protein